MRLTRENTAIVLDSTSDFVDARDRHANMRLVPLYVLFDGESLRDHVDIGPEQFYERLAAAKTLPTTSQPTPGDFLACYEELVAAGYERIWSLHLTSKLSGTYESAVRAAEQLGGERVRLVDTETASLAVALLAEAIDRRLEAGTTDEEIESLVERFKADERCRFHRRDARVPAEGRADRQGPGARGVAPERQADPHRRGRCDRAPRPRPRPAEGARGVREALRRETEDREGLRIAIAHVNAPEWVDVLTDMAAEGQAEGDARARRASRRGRGHPRRAGCRRLLLVPGLIPRARTRRRARRGGSWRTRRGGTVAVVHSGFRGTSADVRNRVVDWFRCLPRRSAPGSEPASQGWTCPRACRRHVRYRAPRCSSAPWRRCPASARPYGGSWHVSGSRRSVTSSPIGRCATSQRPKNARSRSFSVTTRRCST